MLAWGVASAQDAPKKPKRMSYEKIRISPDPKFKLEKAYEFYNNKDYEKAQYLLEDLIPVYKPTPEAERIFFYYAYTHFYLKNFNFANYYFKQFHTTFPASPQAEEALYMSAEASFQMSPNFRLTQEDTHKAIEGMQIFVNAYPTSARVATANQKIDYLRAKLETKEIENAKGYFRRHQYRAAIHTLKALVVEYPDTKELEYIRFMLVKASYKYAQKSVEEKQIERYEESLSYYETFKKRHSDSKYMNEATSIFNSANQELKILRK